MHPARRNPPASRPLRAVLGLAGLLLVSACQDAPAAGGTPSATARCDEVELPALQFGSHLLGDADPPVPYSSVPPTSGWHTSGVPPVGVFDEPLSEPRQVSALEAGGVVVTYRSLEVADLEALTDLVTTELADRVVVTPYDGIDDEDVVFASWGALQRCEGLDLDALRAYAATYATTIEQHEPE